MEQKATKLLNDLYQIQVEKFDKINLKNFIRKSGAKEEIDEASLKKYILQTPIEDLGIDKTALDNHIIHDVLKKPLLIEIKEFRNVSQPFQRAVDLGDEEKKASKARDATYQLQAHDGKRFIKIIMLFTDQSKFVRTINESNKFCLYDAYLSPQDTTTFILDFQEQITQIYNNKDSPRLTEAYSEIKGLPIKYTNAPRFVFLNENAGEEGEKQEEEQEDEFADLFKQFNVPDLTGSERTYIKRYEQLGFWRKKYNPQQQQPQQ
ncbi:UNKNOWN [Stylonychia lemnae]|uniref:Uncharacterized protein n=1 Tax=Stylonychia lemnae TaxID=5949 RepID=A0A077ZS51_STYLE|nr:UNKNOWN [Stylonychia lemnae]|eukprot:CDW71296.1 UNKNOWN [Stylonychia lemnae]